MQERTLNENRKNRSVDFFRLLFTFVILIHHAGSFAGGETPLRHGYLCVEFFFILSGFFLCRSFRGEEEHSTLGYLRRRLDRLYPEYLLAAAVSIFGLGILNREFDLGKAVNELLMLQNTGIFHLGGYNFACWYISVMMVSGLLIYSFLSVREKEFIGIIAPLVVIGGFTWLSGAPDGFEKWGYLGPVSLPLCRGFVDMTAGVLLCVLEDRIRALSERESLLMEVTALIIIFLGFFTDIPGEMLTICGFMLLIFSVTAGENVTCRMLSDSRLLTAASAYSYTLYLNHGLIVKIFQQIGKRRVLPFTIPVYLVLLILYSLVTKRIVKAVVSRLS